MLDPKGRREVIETLKRLNREKGITVALITHFMDEAAEAERVIVMDEGKVVLDGTPKNVFRETEKLKSLGLDAPQITLLASELAKRGVEIDKSVITVEECLAELLKKAGERV